MALFGLLGGKKKSVGLDIGSGIIKLVVIDRQHLGNLLGIGSFIAYGLLCTLVGYFAPAPPRAPAAGGGEEAA